MTAHMAACLPVLKPGSPTHYAMLDLQNDAAVFRTQETLENGCKDIDECVASFEDVGIQDRSMVWNTDLCETLELENLLTNAAVTMHSAEARKVTLTAVLLTSCTRLYLCFCPDSTTLSNVADHTHLLLQGRYTQTLCVANIVPRAWALCNAAQRADPHSVYPGFNQFCRERECVCVCVNDRAGQTACPQWAHAYVIVCCRRAEELMHVRISPSVMTTTG